MTQPISLIAKSLVRERLRTGLSLAEIARRAGIAKSTLSQLSPATVTPARNVVVALRGAGYSFRPPAGAAVADHAGDPPW